MKASFPDRLRRGFTLIEMMLVISLATVVMAGVALLLTGMWRTQRVMDEHRTTMNSISQFAQQFRDDAHAAQNASLTQVGDGQGLEWQQAGKSIEYRFENSSLERAVKKLDATVQRESYRLPAESHVQFGIKPFEAGRLASIAIEYPATYQTDSDVAGRRAFRIEAAIANPRPQSAAAEAK